MKGNQGTMVTYVSICFSMMKLMCYVWWLSYRLVCNHFGWNETSILKIERKSRYHDYTCTYMIVVMIEWWMYLQSFWLKWNQSTGDWKEIKVRWLQMDHYETNEFGIKYESLWLNVKLSFIRLKNSYLHL